MKTVWLIVLTFSLICFEYAAAQIDTLWVSRFNGAANQDDAAKIIKIDQDGFIYVAGTVYPFYGLKSYGVIKYTPDGDSVWVRYFSTTGVMGSELNDITIDNDNNIIVTGTTAGINYTDYATVKWDSDGNLAWAKTFDGGDIDFAYAIAADQSGNVCVTGTSSRANQSYNYLSIKYNPAGDTLWTHMFAGNDDAGDIAYAIAVDNSGSTLVSGSSDWRWGTSDIITFKLNAAGDTVWKSQYNSPQNGQEGFSAMAVDGSDNIYIAGVTFTNNDDIILLKYSLSGDTLWTRKYIGTGNGIDQIVDLVTDDSGNIYAAGKTYNAGTGIDILTIKYNSAGVLQWVKTYAGVGSYGDYAGGLALDDQGNVYVTGTTEKLSINSDYVTVKYDTDGNEKWSIAYHGPDDRNDYAYSICLDDSGYVYVTGMSGSLIGGFDFTTIKYTQTPNIIKGRQQDFPEKFDLLQNYPNPFNPSTVISWQLAVGGAVNLEVYDLTGRKIMTLLNEHQPAGYHQLEFDASQLASGVYLYRLKADDFRETRKMVVMK